MGGTLPALPKAPYQVVQCDVTFMAPVWGTWWEIWILPLFGSQIVDRTLCDSLVSSLRLWGQVCECLLCKGELLRGAVMLQPTPLIIPNFTKGWECLVDAVILTALLNFLSFTPPPLFSTTLICVHEFFLFFVFLFCSIPLLPTQEPSACSLSRSLSLFYLLVQFVH